MAEMAAIQPDPLFWQCPKCLMLDYESEIRAHVEICGAKGQVSHKKPKKKRKQPY